MLVVKINNKTWYWKRVKITVPVISSLFDNRVVSGNKCAVLGNKRAPGMIFSTLTNFTLREKKSILAPGTLHIPEKSDFMKKGAVDTADNKSSLRWIILIPFIIVLGVLAAVVRGGESADDNNTVKAGKHGSANNSETAVKKMVRNNIRLYVKAESNDYESKNLGGISNLEISVNNPTDYTLDKVRVKITYLKPNGSIWETIYEDFHSIKPNSKATHKIPDTKRGTSVKYEVAAIKSKALGLE
jgi:hypothetical protein